MSKKVSVIWHQNMEEIEGVTPVDLLRRAGIIVDVFSANDNLKIIGAHQLVLMAEQKISTLNPNEYEAIVLIGGAGVETLLNNNSLIKLTREFNEKNKLIGAICASPQILGKAGIIDHLKITHYPGNDKFLNNTVDLTPKNLVIDRNIITSVGPGAAIDYSLALIKYLLGENSKNKIKEQIIYQK